MNVFGAFNFGRLIKTFLPGFIILIALVFLTQVTLNLSNIEFNFIKYLKDYQVLIGFMSIPLSLTLGIFSNIVFFTYLNNVLIRNPYKKKHPELIELQKTIAEEIYLYVNNANTFTQDSYLSIKEHFDLDYHMMPKVQLEKLIFLQESYRYYMEFQLNTIFANTFLFPSLILFLWSERNTLPINMSPLIIISTGMVLVYIFLFKICLRAGRLNYEKHRQKHLNYIVSLELEKEQAKFYNSNK